MQSITVRQMSELIGREIMIALESLHVMVVITDAKVAWGTLRLQVRPVAGGLNTTWVETSRVLTDLNIKPV